MSFVIITDSAANLTNELIDKNEIGIVSLEFLVEAKPYRSYIKGEKNDLKQFYDMMRNKEHITTSAVNQQTWMDGIEPLAELDALANLNVDVLQEQLNTRLPVDACTLSVVKPL